MRYMDEAAQRKPSRRNLYYVGGRVPSSFSFMDPVWTKRRNVEGLDCMTSLCDPRCKRASRCFASDACLPWHVGSCRLQARRVVQGSGSIRKGDIRPLWIKDGAGEGIR